MKSELDSNAIRSLESRREPVDPEPFRLRAGALTMFFEPATAFLRCIGLGDVEVIRGVYAAVRDRHWGTALPIISDFKSQIANDSFALRFDAECRQGDIHFRWRGEITGAADGTVTFRFDGEALQSFFRNRIGFCVLHPIRECAGARARQTRTDGRVVECRFPDAIEPQIFGRSPFRDLRAVAHEVAAGLWAEVEFEGDVFEMEDQRNWTDASFKTYCTPLALPFPVEIRAGTRVRQSITLRLAGARTGLGGGRVEVAGPGVAEVTLTPPPAPGLPMPRLGLGVASHGEPLTDGEQALGRFPLTEPDFIFWSINPQVHATDDGSVMETLEAQCDTVKSARVFAGNKPLVVSPVTLKQRFNPVATGPEPAPPPGELPRQVDPRQRTLFGAAWTLGSLAALTAAGVESATFYETTGWRGVMETEAGSRLPQKFPSQPGEVFPLFHVFAALAGFDHVTSVATDSRLAALALSRAAGGGRILLANPTHAPLEIRLAGCRTAARICSLDAANLTARSDRPGAFLAQGQEAVAAPSGGVKVPLRAYALACIDLP